MPDTTKKVLDDEDLLDKTRDRIDTCYQEYDDIYLAVSGGKDSMSVYNAVMDGWERNGGLEENNPIKIIFHDNETPFPETIDLFKRILEKYPDEVYFYWVCAPMIASLMTNPKNRTWMMPWDERCPDRWVRPMPDWVSEYDNVKLVRPDQPALDDFEMGDQHRDIAYQIIDHEMDDRDQDREDVIQLVGLRAEESMNRYTTILQLGGFRQQNGTDAPCHIGHPVYDWSTDDLWALHHQQDWDYNHYYDKMHQKGMAASKVRNGHPWGSYPIRAKKAMNARNWWPNLFEKWERRYDGSIFAFEFGYDLFDIEADPNEGETWREYCARLLNTYDGDAKEKERKLMNERLERHWDHSDVPLQEEKTCPVCGMSWRELARDLNEKLNNHYIDIH